MLYHSKVRLVQKVNNQIAIGELKVWQVNVNPSFPEGIKYSLFLVDLASGEIVVGFDNHKPKGHHVHFGKVEKVYDFKSVEILLDDFWKEVKKRGYLLS